MLIVWQALELASMDFFHFTHAPLFLKDTIAFPKAIEVGLAAGWALEIVILEWRHDHVI
jgi:hypothetical protein